MDEAEGLGFLVFYCGCSIAVMLMFGLIGYSMGKSKTVGPVGGFLLGAFLSWIGLIVIAVSGDARNANNAPRHRRPSGRHKRQEYGEPEMVEEEFELRISCPKCSKKFTITDPARAGQKAKCDGCGTVFRIPEVPQ